MTVAAVEALELSQLLGSLLASVVEAQAASARATVDFVESVGFEPGTDGERMRTVRLRYRKKDENSIPADFEVEVPLLALVNVPSLAVKQARLTFSYQVVRNRGGSTARPRRAAARDPARTGDAHRLPPAAPISDARTLSQHHLRRPRRHPRTARATHRGRAALRPRRAGNARGRAQAVRGEHQHPRGTRQGGREPELPAPRDQARASTGVRDTRTGEGRPTTRQLPLVSRVVHTLRESAERDL